MKNDLLVKIAEQLMRCPAAPYHEHLVATSVIRVCEEFGLFWQSDSFGNLIVRAAKKRLGAPIVLAAHMDHPGFVIRGGARDGVYSGEFLGGVGDDYFKPGTKLRLMPQHVPAELGRRIDEKRRSFEIKRLDEVKLSPEYAVWDLPEFEFNDGIIRGRVCDDLIGCATIFAVLISLRSTKAAGNAIGVFSRAEEVGFHGALALAQSKRIPRKSLVISLETSRELPPVKMGNGVIIRVGDRASIFDSASTRFLAEVASDLAKKNKEFQFQRALMSGGTCEATAYQEFGYRSAAVCVALGNYHNCGADDEIGAEFVSASDAASMRELLAECARVWDKADRFTARLPQRLAKLSKEAHRELRKHPLNLS